LEVPPVAWQRAVNVGVENKLLTCHQLNGFGRKFTVQHFREKVLSCEIRKTLNVELLLRIERSQLYVDSDMNPGWPMKHCRGKSCWPHPRESGPEVVQGPGGMITSPILLSPVLVRSQ